MSHPPFTAADFAKWNSTTSCFRIPKHLVSKETVKQVRVALIQAFGALKVSAIQALPNCQYRVEFSTPSYKVAYDINGLNFRGVHINPTPAYERVTRVFVDRAPLQMPDNYLSSALAPYGHVIGVQHLTVRGYNNIRTGTRMVSMALEKPIPSELTIASFSCSVKYQGQPKYCFACQSFGHFGRQCPKSAAKRDRPTTNNKNNDPAPTRMGRDLPNTATEATTTLPTAAAGKPSVQKVHVTSRPIDIGASTSRDYVDPSSAPPPSQTAMDIVEPAAMEDSSSPVLDTTVVAGTVTISLTEFKSSSPAGGDYSYTRHVSVKRLTKKERCAERVIARGVARSRRLARLAEVRARAAHRTTAPSADSGVLFSPPASPVVTANRFVVLQDEVEETVEVAQISPSRIPLAWVSPARVSPTRVPPARVSPPQPDGDDLAAIGASVVDPLATLQSTSLSPAPASIQGSVALSAQGTPVADIPSSSASEGQASGAFSPVASEQVGPICDSRCALVPIGFDFDSDLRLPHADALHLGAQSLAASSLFGLPMEVSFPLGEVRSVHSDGPLTTPSFHFTSGTSLTPPSDAGSFYTRSLEPFFQDGASDQHFSDAETSALPALPAPPTLGDGVGDSPGQSARPSPKVV